MKPLELNERVCREIQTRAPIQMKKLNSKP